MEPRNIDVNSIYGQYGIQVVDYNYTDALGDLKYTKIGQLFVRSVWSKEKKYDRDREIHMVAIAQ